MTNPYVAIIELAGNGDERGCSYSIPQRALDYIGRVKDVHLASIGPGKIRGNHYHTGRKEFIVILYENQWVFAWETADETAGQQKHFDGRGCVLTEIESGVVHAIKNTGKTPLYIMAFSPTRYDPEHSDTVSKRIME